MNKSQKYTPFELFMLWLGRVIAAIGGIAILYMIIS